MEPISSNCQYDFCSLYNIGYIYIYIAGDYYEVLLLSNELRFRRKEKKTKQICPPAMSGIIVPNQNLQVV